MAKSLKKTEVKEKVETAVEVKESAEIKVRMIKTYCGSAGCFYAGKTYSLSKPVADNFINSGDAYVNN